MPTASSKPCASMSEYLTSDRHWQDFSFSFVVDLPNRGSIDLITKNDGHVFSHKKSGEGKHCRVRAVEWLDMVFQVQRKPSRNQPVWWTVCPNSKHKDITKPCYENVRSPF